MPPQIIIELTNRNFGLPELTHGRNGHQPRAIVNHIIEGTLPGYRAWVRQPKRNSATYAVGKRGEIIAVVQISDVAWCNGPMARPDLSRTLIAHWWNDHVNPNLETVSIEHEGKTGEPMPEPQYQSTLWLHHHIHDETGIPLDKQHVFGHFQIDSVNKSRCPGTGFPWVRLWRDLTPDADPWEGIGEGLVAYGRAHSALGTPNLDLHHGWDQDGDEVVKLHSGVVLYWHKATNHITECR